ncbi:MAG: hypothetical protein R3F37_18030 [Candidatus Competibacteraceae bacterium]
MPVPAGVGGRFVYAARSAVDWFIDFERFSGCCGMRCPGVEPVGWGGGQLVSNERCNQRGYRVLLRIFQRLRTAKRYPAHQDGNDETRPAINTAHR